MSKKLRSAAECVAEAYRRAYQLRRTLIRLLQTRDEKDQSWHDLANDADIMERRLRGAMTRMNNVLVEDPASYTPPPSFKQ